jgi:hypothetical protein
MLRFVVQSLFCPLVFIIFKSYTLSQRESSFFIQNYFHFVQEVPIIDIPVEVSRRPCSEYKDRLIEELKRPFDDCEYRELMEKSALRTKKIVYKELHSMENDVETEATPRLRERAIETEKDSKSFFDWYPGKVHIFFFEFIS